MAGVGNDAIGAVQGPKRAFSVRLDGTSHRWKCLICRSLSDDTIVERSSAVAGRAMVGGRLDVILRNGNGGVG